MKLAQKISILYFSILSLNLAAQQPEQNFGEPKNYFNTAIMSSGNYHGLSFGWERLHGLGKRKAFNLGYGIRYSLAGGTNIGFTTAPAKLTSGQTGPQVFFSENLVNNIDTITFKNISQHSINLSIHIAYVFSKKFQAEFNIDAAGFSFGGIRTGTFKSSADSLNKFNGNVTARPTPFNLLLVSDNDLGQLNSEIALSYFVKPNIGIRFGASFLFSEFTTDKKLYLDNDRFRYKSLMGMIGIVYRPFKKDDDGNAERAEY
jgi:hypothetical protein